MPWVTSTISPTSTSASTGCSGSIRAPSPSPTPITSASSSSWPTRRSNTSRTRGGRRADLYEESLAAEIEAIEAGIRDDKATNLQTYKREIMETLNGAVILRYSYAEGVTEHTLTEDREVHRAVALLDDGKEYARILHEQDTVRK